MIREMPERFSRKWWKLWFSGAIPRVPVFLDYMADELVKYKARSELSYRDAFGGLDPEAVRRGGKLRISKLPLLNTWTRPLLDLGARVNGDLRLTRNTKIYDEVFRLLIGRTAPEADEAWRNPPKIGSR